MLNKLTSFLQWTTSALSSRNIMGGFKQVDTQFIAALGDPKASSGTGAEQWGIWRIDPGPRGVQLQNFKQLGWFEMYIIFEFILKIQNTPFS